MEVAKAKTVDESDEISQEVETLRYALIEREMRLTTRRFCVVTSSFVPRHAQNPDAGVKN